MKVLVLTNEKYFDFISKIVFDANGSLENDVHAYYEYDPYPFFHEISYEIGISFMYQHRVPKVALNRATWFNFHPAPLPEYKGRNLCYHAIMNGSKEFGATLHYMDEGFDTGDIIEVVRQFMFPSDTAGVLSKRTVELSKELFRAYFPRIIAGERFDRLPNVGGTYYRKDAIIDTVKLTEGEPFGQFVRAVTYGDFYPKVDIGGMKYKIVREE